jgi:protein disulfide-isomerase
MQSRKSFLVSLALIASLSAFSRAAELPYDEKANASEQTRQALQSAQASHKDVLLVFGANWCPDCRVLHAALQGKGASLISERFVVVKVDVGNFDKNLDLASRYGVPLRKGIPAAAVVSSDDTLLYVTKAGELANAHRMGESEILEFFSRIVADATSTSH